MNAEKGYAVDNHLEPWQLYRLRMDDLDHAERYLAAQAEMYKRRSSGLRLLLIVLGVTVAIKAVVDQLMLTYQISGETRMALDVLFIIIGLTICVAAWLQDAFNPGWRATGLRQLSIKAREYSRRFMTAAAISIKNPEDFWEVIEGQNNALQSLYDAAALYDVNLAYKSQVNYSEAREHARRPNPGPPADR